MLIRDGHAEHPYIGVALRDVRDLDPVERVRWGERLPARGALVSRIMRDAPAARAGLRAGDVITSINNRDIPAATELADSGGDAGGRGTAPGRLHAWRGIAYGAAIGGGTTRRAAGLLRPRASNERLKECFVRRTVRPLRWDRPASRA